MSILNKIRVLFSRPQTKDVAASIDEQPISIAEKVSKVYGQDQFAKQRLYEKWSCKDTWLLYREGIPLLLGIEPGNNDGLDEELVQKIDDLWIHAQACVQKKLLPVTNEQKSAAEWEVRPLALYSWATVSRIAVPAELSSLMAFVAQTVKMTTSDQGTMQSNNTEDVVYLKHREIVLGAALSLLVNTPERCKNSKGRLMSSLISKQIIENEEQWFADERPLLTQTAMNDLIDGYLELSKPVVS